MGKTFPFLKKTFHSSIYEFHSFTNKSTNSHLYWIQDVLDYFSKSGSSCSVCGVFIQTMGDRGTCRFEMQILVENTTPHLMEAALQLAGGRGGGGPYRTIQ